MGTRVVIVDDHEVVRVGLASLLADVPEFDVVAMASTAADAVELVRFQQPDVLVLDIRLPDRSGLDIVPELRKAAPAMRILALTSYGEDQAVVAAVAAGVDGFLTKTVDGEALIATIRSLAEGRAPLRDQVADALVRYVRGDEPQSAERPKISSLTRRELEVAWAVAEGLSNREIATRLALSEKTVKNHVSDILDKLGLSRRAQIVALFHSGDMVR